MEALGLMLVVYLVVVTLLFIVPIWKLYEKAGQPGWAVLVPFYNIIIWLRIIGKPWWWLLLMMIPYVGIIWSIWSINLLVKRFGKSEGYTVGVIFLGFIFLPMLGYGSSKYIPLEKTEE